MAEYRALLVDDQPDAIESLAVVLKDAGCVVRLASSGAEAVRAVAAFQPLCVLMDLEMPEMSGVELTRHLRAQYGSDLVLIAVTGHPRAGQMASEGLEAGLDYVITKPIDIPQLLKVMGVEP